MPPIDAETMFALNGITVEPNRLPALQEAYARWRLMTAPLHEPVPFADEILFPFAGPRR